MLRYYAHKESPRTCKAKGLHFSGAAVKYSLLFM